MTDIFPIFSVQSPTIGIVHGGAVLNQTLEVARRMKIDYIIFNGRLLPSGMPELDIPNYQEKYPQVRDLEELLTHRSLRLR